MKKLRALLERSKAEAAVERKKALEVFQGLEELHEEKLVFSSDTYNIDKQFIWDKVIAHHPELDLSFLDEDDLDEGGS